MAMLTEEKLPNFGVVLPPSNLKSLVRDMNCPATRMAYKPLTVSTHVGLIKASNVLFSFSTLNYYYLKFNLHSYSNFTEVANCVTNLFNFMNWLTL